jgi:hypothetical protein
MINDCFRYYKGCEGRCLSSACCVDAFYYQALAFKGLDFIGKIHPSSSKRHCFMIVTTDYFTEWAETIPLKNTIHKEVIGLITKHTIHRFGIPLTLING